MRSSITTLILGLCAVAYTTDEVYYTWSDPAKAVGYEGKLQLSQFDIKDTSFRGLNFSRGASSEQTYADH